MYQIELRFKHATKGWIWLYALGSLVQSDDKGSPVRMIGFNQDISDLKNIERRWREALDGVGDGIWDFSLDTNKLFLSPALYKMSGYDVNEFPASKEELHKRIHPDAQVMVQEFLDAYIKGKIPEYNVEYRFMQKNGEWKSNPRLWRNLFVSAHVSCRSYRLALSAWVLLVDLFIFFNKLP